MFYLHVSSCRIGYHTIWSLLFLLALGIDPNVQSYGKILTASIMFNMYSVHAGLVKVRQLSDDIRTIITIIYIYICAFTGVEPCETALPGYACVIIQILYHVHYNPLLYLFVQLMK